MTESDLTLFNNAIQLFNNGQKVTANNNFKELAQRYPLDTTIWLWLAFSSSELREARAALSQIEQLEPNNPNLPNARNWLQQWEQQNAAMPASLPTSNDQQVYISPTATETQPRQESLSPTAQPAIPNTEASQNPTTQPDNIENLGQCIEIYEKSSDKAFFRGYIALAVFGISLITYILTNFILTNADRGLKTFVIAPLVISFITCYVFGIWGLLVREEQLTVYEDGFIIESKGQIYSYLWENLNSFTYTHFTYSVNFIPVFFYRWHILNTFDGQKWVVNGNYKKIKELEVLLSTLTTTGLLRKIAYQLHNGQTVQINKQTVANPEGLSIKKKFANWPEFIEPKMASGVLTIKTGYMEGNKPKTKTFANLKVMETENALLLFKLVPFMATNPPNSLKR